MKYGSNGFGRSIYYRIIFKNNVELAENKIKINRLQLIQYALETVHHFQNDGESC